VVQDRLVQEGGLVQDALWRRVGRAGVAAPPDGADLTQLLSPRCLPAVERMWHIQGSHCQILALAFGQTSLICFGCSLFALKREALRELPEGHVRRRVLE